MGIRQLAVAAWLAAAAPALAAAGTPAPPAVPPVQVMVLAAFHMDNPGLDMNNVKVDDVLTPRRQAEIARVVDGLARFRPTVVMLEAGPAWVARRWPEDKTGAAKPERDESVQVGLRLAAQAHVREVRGIDVKGDFPFDPVAAYAAAHGQTGVVEQMMAAGAQATRSQELELAQGGVAGVFRLINSPAWLAASQAPYRQALKVGGEDAQPGAELVSAWYVRNLKICAKLVQSARPGDRVVVMFGAGHAFLLRQCVAETPGFQLVEAIAYLPR